MTSVKMQNWDTESKHSSFPCFPGCRRTRLSKSSTACYWPCSALSIVWHAPRLPNSKLRNPCTFCSRVTLIAGSMPPLIAASMLPLVAASILSCLHVTLCSAHTRKSSMVTKKRSKQILACDVTQSQRTPLLSCQACSQNSLSTMASRWSSKLCRFGTQQLEQLRLKVLRAEVPRNRDQA